MLRVWPPHVLNLASICDPIVSNAIASICCRIDPAAVQRHRGHRFVIIWGTNISGRFRLLCRQQTDVSNNPPGATCVQCFGMAPQRHVVILPVSSLGISVCFLYGSRGYSSADCIVVARHRCRSHRGSSLKAFNRSTGNAGSKARACTAHGAGPPPRTRVHRGPCMERLHTHTWASTLRACSDAVEFVCPNRLRSGERLLGCGLCRNGQLRGLPRSRRQQSCLQRSRGWQRPRRQHSLSRQRPPPRSQRWRKGLWWKRSPSIHIVRSTTLSSGNSTRTVGGGITIAASLIVWRNVINRVPR